MKKAILFKQFSLIKFKPNNSPIISIELLNLVKYFSLGDYKSFILTERTIIECLMKLNLNDQLEDTTTKLISNCKFNSNNQTTIKGFYKINSKVIHHSKLDNNYVHYYVSNMYDVDNSFSLEKRKGLIKNFKTVVEIVLNKIIKNYSQEVKASFGRDDYSLKYLLGLNFKNKLATGLK
ncbi:hypothetical protein [Limosilactobacillus galli]|uniref:hypothetical protein n=1 Tax=Limosilactobacillus galli TaxID=2991834 RepID=UPI0024BADF99|nr:hypothetical protein [Limosilactobacillus galli]